MHLARILTRFAMFPSIPGEGKPVDSGPGDLQPPTASRENCDEVIYEMPITPRIKLNISQTPARGIGFQVWPAAYALADHLVTEESLQGRHVLELGSGPGLVGILAAHLGASATLTDLRDVLHLTRNNVERNTLHNAVPDSGFGAMEVCELSWGSDIRQDFRRTCYYLILCSDLTYFGHLHKPLLTTLLQLAAPGVDILLAHAHRKDASESWHELFGQHFRIEVLRHVTEGSRRSANTCSSGSQSGSASESTSVSVYRLSLLGTPLAHSQISNLLEELSSVDRGQLLARLEQLERDLDNIEVDENQ